MGGDEEAKEQTTTTTPAQAADYARLNAMAGQTMDAGGFFDPTYGGGEVTRAGQSQQQQSLMEQMGGPRGTGQMGLDALTRQLGPYDPNNAALTGAIDMAAGDVTRNLQENLLPAIGDAGTSAGQFGSSRHGIAEGLALRGASEQVGDIATQMRLQDMQAHQAGQQGALANLGSLQSGIEFAGSGEQREEQSRLDDLFSKWEYESGVDLQNQLAYKGIISGDQGGTTTGPPAEGGGK